MSFRAELTINSGWSWDDGAKDASKLTYQETMAGTDATNTADAVWHDEARALTDGASDLFDLSSLTRTVLGATLTTVMTKIKAIHIVNTSTSGGKLIVGNADYDCWNEPFGASDHTFEVPLDSSAMISNRRAGWPVTGLGDSSSSSSGDGASDRMLKVAASGGAVTYSIAIIGET